MKQRMTAHVKQTKRQKGKEKEQGGRKAERV